MRFAWFAIAAALASLGCQGNVARPPVQRAAAIRADSAERPTGHDVALVFGLSGCAVIQSCASVKIYRAYAAFGTADARDRDSLLGFRIDPATEFGLVNDEEVRNLCQSLLDPASYESPWRPFSVVFYPSVAFVLSDDAGRSVAIIEGGGEIQSTGGRLFCTRNFGMFLRRLHEGVLGRIR